MNNVKEWEKIIKGVKEGREESYNEFFLVFKNYVYFIASQYMNSQQDREDLTQNAFILIFEHINEVRDVEKILYWIKRVVATAYQSYRKHNGRIKRKRDIYDGDISELENIYDKDKPLPDEVAIRNDEEEELMIAINMLSEKQRRIIFLYYFQGFTMKEISRMEVCSEGSVKNILVRAKDSLRKKITVDYGVKFGSVIALAFGNELKSFRMPVEVSNHIWKGLSGKAKLISKVAVLKGSFLALGVSILLLATVVVGSIAFYNNAQGDGESVAITSDLLSDMANANEIIKETPLLEEVPLGKNGEMVGGIPDYNYGIVPSFTIFQIVQLEEVADPPAGRQLLTIDDFLSAQDVSFVKNAIAGISESDAGRLWDIFDNNDLHLRDTRYDGTQEFLYRAMKEDTLLYIGVRRDMASRMVYVTYVVRDVDDAYLEDRLLDEMW